MQAPSKACLSTLDMSSDMFAGWYDVKFGSAGFNVRSCELLSAAFDSTPLPWQAPK